MKKSSLYKTLFILFLSYFFSHAALSQNKPVQITGIPFPLSWENKPVNYSLKGQVLTIEAGAKTDMFRDPNVTYNTDNAPKLLFTADNDFVFTARIEHDFASKWDGGAIVLKTDALHWVKFCFEKDYTGIHRVVSVVTNDISDDCNSVPLTQNYVYYKIAKADNVVTLYFSAEGKKWFLIRHFQYNAKGPLKLGFLAQSPTGTHKLVRFSDITYQHKKIKDPYTGE
jgi:regulation of enolase protein 1 (concanavalin A-like superfamily)